MKGIPQTNVMTGNMTQLGIATTELILAWRRFAHSRHGAAAVRKFEEVRAQLLVVLSVALGFLVGAAAGAVVIDNSSTWRMDPDVPLIVPEVNADAVSGFIKKNIIANPNCSTAQLVVALKPLHDHAVIKRVVVSTYQSVSGAGKDAMDELFSQTKAVYTNSELVNKKFPKRIAFNVSPRTRSLVTACA